MMLDCAASGTPTFVVEYPERLNLRRRLRRDLYRVIRAIVDRSSTWGLARVGAWLDRAQERLHAGGILRYPRDLRQLNASIFDMALAKRIIDFDPARLPVRAQVANDRTIFVMVGLGPTIHEFRWAATHRRKQTRGWSRQARP